MEQVGLAQPGAAVDEQRVVGLGRRLGHGHGGRVGEPVGRADHEPLEGVLGRELGPVGHWPWLRGRPGKLLVGGVVQRADGHADVERPAHDPADGGDHRRRVALLDPFLDEVVRDG